MTTGKWGHCREKGNPPFPYSCSLRTLKSLQSLSLKLA